MADKKYATITTRKGQFLVDISRKDTEKKLTFYEVTPSGSLKEIAETPVISRLEAFSVLNAVTSYRKIQEKLASFPGLKLPSDLPPSMPKAAELVPSSSEWDGGDEEEDGGGEVRATKRRGKPAARKPRKSVW